MTTRFHSAPLDRIDTFTYPDIAGEGTITHLGDLDGLRYFHVDDGVPLPTAPGASFQPVDLSDELAAKLRTVAPAASLPLIVTDGERKGKEKQDINAERDRRLVAGVTFNGETYHTDDRFLTELLGMVLGYSASILSGQQSIRTRDNKIMKLGQAEIAMLAGAVGEYRKAVYAWSWAAKDALQ